MTDALPTHAVDGTLAEATDGFELVFSRELRATPESIWLAITTPEGLESWGPYSPSRNLHSPGAVTQQLLGTDLASEEHVLAVEENRLLEVTWGDDVLHFEIEPVREGEEPLTRLTLTHRFESPDIAPNMASGWHLSLQALDGRLSGLNVPRVAGEAAFDHGYSELFDAYQGRFGLGTID